MKKFFKAILVLFLLLVGVLLARTYLVKSRQIQASAVEKIQLDTDVIVNHLSGALRIQTVSYDDPSKLNSTEFLAFHDYLRNGYPLVHERLSVEKVNEYSLLYRWEGKDSKLPPIVLMAHMDVVPVEATPWKYPPFSGEVADDYIWGRGALDDKSCVISQLDAVEYLLQKGFQPKQTIYLAYGHDEEAGGQGAAAVARLLDSRGVKPDVVLDEGGAILNEFVPGLLAPTAMIGTSEKGYVTLDLTLKDAGGHSSAPPEHTAIGILSRAVQRLEDHQMPAALEGSAAQMMDFVGPELPFASRFFVANRWFFQPLIVFALSKVRIANAMVRTTTAVTMIEGGVKENVLPSQVTATVNFRIRPGETMDDVVNHVRSTIANENIEIKRRPQGMDPSPISPSDSPQFELLHRTIRQVFPEVIVVPGIVIGATDARHFAKISRNVYRFAPFRVTMEDFRGVHGTNERIRQDVYVDMVRFYVQFLRNVSQEK